MKILITGGNGDIAVAIKELLEEKGYTIYAPSKEEMDVTVPLQIERAMSAFQPDILINNAGYVVPQSIRNADLNNTKRHIEINLLGVLYCSQIGMRYNPNLKIINVGSAAAVKVHPTWSEYCASKAGVAMLNKCWAEDGVFSVCLSPGRTLTRMRKSLFEDEDPNTLLDPNDFAKVVLMAVENKFSSGTHLMVRRETVEEILLGNLEGKEI